MLHVSVKQLQALKVRSSKPKWSCIISKPTGRCSPRRLSCLILENKGSWIL